MKKIFQLLSILFFGVITCACVNVFAVHELNQIASEYINNGDTLSAISRLEASIDLDGTIYESRYNLASAYVSVGECEKAIKQAEEGIKLEPKEPAIYYTHAVALSCAADKIFEKTNQDGTKEEIVYNDNLLPVKKQEYVNFLESANKSFEKYIDLVPNAEDSRQVIELINENKNIISQTKEQYGI